MRKSARKRRKLEKSLTTKYAGITEELGQIEWKKGADHATPVLLERRFPDRGSQDGTIQRYRPYKRQNVVFTQREFPTRKNPRFWVWGLFSKSSGHKLCGIFSLYHPSQWLRFLRYIRTLFQRMFRNLR